MRTHYKPTFQYTTFYSCHPPGVTKGFIKGEALRRLRTNSSKTTIHYFEATMRDFMSHLISRGYPVSLVKKHLGEVQFMISDRHSALTQKKSNRTKENIAVCNTILPSTTCFQKHTKSTKREMAPYTKPSKVKRNFQGASSLIVQQREISQKHSSLS